VILKSQNPNPYITGYSFHQPFQTLHTFRRHSISLSSQSIVQQTKLQFREKHKQLKNLNLETTQQPLPVKNKHEKQTKT